MLQRPGEALSSPPGAYAMTRSPDNIDRYVADRIRTLRRLHGLSQDNLAFDLGVTTPQFRKYDAGINRVSASVLHRLTMILGVPITALFDGAPSHAGNVPDGIRPLSSPPNDDLCTLYQAWRRIPDPVLRQILLHLIEHLGNPPEQR